VSEPDDALDPALDAELDARTRSLQEAQDLAAHLYDILEFRVAHAPAGEVG
jgi:hypothetical protein